MENINTLDLLDNLDAGNHGGRLNDYRDEDGYICDVISEIADNDTSIYYSDILDFVRSNPEALSEVIDEGFYDPSHNYDFWEHARAAEYIAIERDIYKHLNDSLMCAAVNYIRYDLNRETVPAELAELLREWCDEADNNDRMSEIPEKIEEYFDELENAAFYAFCEAQNCDICPFCDCKSLDECKSEFKKKTPEEVEA